MECVAFLPLVSGQHCMRDSYIQGVVNNIENSFSVPVL